ncbi:Uncharacterised protein [[Flavobacterium] thermophilum]|nr:Uncharacterised protein [[Flavobacterium] thermophilum]
MVKEIEEMKKHLATLKERYYENKGSHIDYFFEVAENVLDRLERYIKNRIESGK